MDKFVVIALLFFLLGFSGWLSASETALFSLSSMKVRSLRLEKTKSGKLIARLLSRPKELLVTILMTNVVMNVLVQNVVSGVFGAFSSWATSVGVPLGLTLVFGEVVPKSIAYSKKVWIARRAAPLLKWIASTIKPIRILLTRLTSFVSHVLFFYLQKDPDISTEELKHVLKESSEKGVLDPEEAKLVRGYLNLEEDIVKELMCPRQEICFFSLDDSLDKLADLFVSAEYSRIPVCRGSLENLVGVLSSASFFLHKKRIHHTYDLIPFLDPLHFIPESTTGLSLLHRFYQCEETFMMVVDEYGSISGLITLEDLLETVIGQVDDRQSETVDYTRPSEDILIANATLELSEFERIFDIHLESPSNMATLGGWLTEQLGDIPKSGSRYLSNGFLFHVLSAEENRVCRIYVRRVKGLKKRGRKSLDG